MIAATVATAGVVADTVGRVGFWADFIPSAVRPYVPLLYLLGFAIALAVTRAEKSEPRLIFDLQYNRADPRYADPNVDIHPFFVRNDGSDTALSIEIRQSKADDMPFLLLPQRSSALPTEEVGVRIYVIGGLVAEYKGGRVDHDIEAALVEPIKKRVKSGVKDRIEVRLPVLLMYQDHGGRQYHANYSITLGVFPRDGGFQMERPRVIREPND